MINWTIRAKNPLFWVQLIAAIAAPMLAGVGVAWEDVTSWPTLWGVVVQAVSNPVVVLAMAVAAWGVINDPTSNGISDTDEVLKLSEPKHAK